MRDVMLCMVRGLMHRVCYGYDISNLDKDTDLEITLYRFRIQLRTANYFGLSISVTDIGCLRNRKSLTVMKVTRSAYVGIGSAGP